MPDPQVDRGFWQLSLLIDFSDYNVGLNKIHSSWPTNLVIDQLQNSTRDVGSEKEAFAGFTVKSGRVASTRPKVGKNGMITRVPH